MFESVECIHKKIVEKLSTLKESLELLREPADILRNLASGHNGRKYTECITILDDLHINLLLDNLNELENNYNLAVVSVLSEYYNKTENEEKSTRSYYRIITSENFISKIDDFIFRAENVLNAIRRVLNINLLAKAQHKNTEYLLDNVAKKLDCASNMKISILLEKRNYEICKCGTRMTVVPELSELHCANPTCSRVKTIIGAVFRDEQFYTQEGQKTKHGGYDTSRHYRFWIERLQALEQKTFDEQDITKIEYIILRDVRVRRMLTCEVMREILKDPLVNATSLNDHTPLLVKTFGGPAPPQLDFQENRLCSIRFNKAMRLYDIVNPDGGNKPYYPYFIYKILEHMFKDNPEKLRLLDYIHLQSRETVIKNDKYYEQMCALADEQDGLVYTPTDPAGRL